MQRTRDREAELVVGWPRQRIDCLQFISDVPNAELGSVEPTGRQPRTMHAQIERSVHVAKARKWAVEKTIVVKGNVLTSLPASS